MPRRDLNQSSTDVRRRILKKAMRKKNKHQIDMSLHEGKESFSKQSNNVFIEKNPEIELATKGTV